MIYERLVIYYKTGLVTDESNRPPDKVVQQWLSIGCLIDHGADIQDNFLVIALPTRASFLFNTHQEVTAFMRDHLLKDKVLQNMIQFLKDTETAKD